MWREGKRVRAEYLGKATEPPWVEGLEGRVEVDFTRGGVALHPYRAGDVVTFVEDGRPFWVVVDGRRQYVRDDAPSMTVESTGWGRFGRGYKTHAYVTLVVEWERPSRGRKQLSGSGSALAPVYHPYAPSMLDADPLRRLDRRFPVGLVQPIVVPKLVGKRGRGF